MSIFDKLRAGIVTRSAAEMQAVAAEIGREILSRSAAETIFALHGDLGTGKTTFTQGLARALGIQDPVTSPTFGIFALHRGKPISLVHLDAYRLENAAQLEDLMIEDFLRPPYVLVAEWPEKVAEWIPADAIHLWLSIAADESHEIGLKEPLTGARAARPHSS
jgi:tRNA threonylcarbamoyladenosine biosynthesis protein TsaE